MGTEPHRTTKVQAADDFASTMKSIHTEVQAALSKAQNSMKIQADQRRSPTPDYQIGDQVLMSTCDHSTAKLADRWLGPYKITAILPSRNAVVLQLPNHLKIHPTINISKLKIYNKPIPHQPNAPSNPPPILTPTGNPEFEVESIRDSKLNRRRRPHRTEFLVKWKGYPDSENTWEPEEHLKNSPLALQ